MENKSLTKEQVKKLLDNATANNFSREDVVKRLVERGFKLEGLNTNTAPVQSKQTFLQDAGSDIKQIGTEIKDSFQKRKENVATSNQAFSNGEQGQLSQGVQGIGQAAGFASDAIGSAFKGAIKAILPQKAEEGLKKGLQTVAEPIVQSQPVQSVLNKYKQLQETNPEAARNIDGLLGIGALTLDVAGAGEAIEGGIKGIKAGAKLAKTGAMSVGESGTKLSGAIEQNIGNALEKTGQKIQMSVIKPSTRDIKDGFKIENVSKYDVGGDLAETVAKSHVKMNELSNQLSKKLSSSDSKIDLIESYDETVKRLLGDKTKTFGDNTAIQRVLKNLKSEIEGAAPDGNVDLLQATNIKRGAGTKGAWAYNRPEADASAIEKVYSEFYDVLKNKIEKTAPDGVKEINKQISELIPINNAALRRMTVEERNNILNITEAIGLTSALFDPKALLFVGANKALKSGKFGSFLTKSAQKFKK